MRTYLLDPFNSPDLMENRIFLSPYRVLKDILKAKGVDLKTYDQGNLASAEKILCFNHNPRLMETCHKSHITRDKLILFMFEPEVVRPDQYNIKVQEYYTRIFTYRDDLVDNHKFFKLRYPQGQHISAKLPTYSMRKWLTLINANKYSYVKNELYSFRRKAIRFFDNSPKFDLFGHGWNERSVIRSREYLRMAWRSGHLMTYGRDLWDALNPYQSFRGTVHDKYSTLANYQFCLCFENEKDAPGYVTEKIFDCFFTGTIPIYLGAPNIAHYIPKSSFIDMRKFSDFAQLARFIETFDQIRFERMQLSGHDFIRSAIFDQWKPEGVFNEIANNIL